ncbi:MAG: ABC transporter permease [Candidatus Latescibacteria bacterium]|nr:ABC transporter permease [Candidatus Latescibacterota bacterium]
MIRHLLRLAWNRKRNSMLLGAELLVSFLALAWVCTAVVSLWSSYRHPLGFEYREVWAIGMNTTGGKWVMQTRADSVAQRQVRRALEGFEEVVAVAQESCPPFMHCRSGQRQIVGQILDYYYSVASDQLDEVLRLDLVAGRWFEPEDEGLAVEPIVLNQKLARQLFGEGEAVGKSLIFSQKEQSRESRVVGVVSDHRFYSPFEEPGFFVFRRMSLERAGSEEGITPLSYLIRVRPGTSRSFGKQITQRLRAVVPQWVPNIKPLEEGRAEIIWEKVRFFALYLLISGSLLLMVALGLVGVLWQSVTQRTKEIGIRLATGAQARHVYVQFTGEMLVLTTVAVVVGVGLVLNSAVLDLFPGVSVGVYAAGLLSAAAVLYLLVIAASMYPGWLATQIQPAQALHYE